MNITHYLTNTSFGNTHTVAFTVTHNQCVVSSETWDSEDTLGGPWNCTPKMNYTIQSGRELYKSYLAEGYTA